MGIRTFLGIHGGKGEAEGCDIRFLFAYEKNNLLPRRLCQARSFFRRKLLKLSALTRNVDPESGLALNRV
jgi:hypothetical protein